VFAFFTCFNLCSLCVGTADNVNRTVVADAVEGNEEQDEEYSDNFEDEKSPEAEPLDTEDPPRPSAPVRTV